MCSFDGCGRPVLARTLCGGHYSQQWRGGVLVPLRSAAGTFDERFRAYVQESDGCHLWTAATSRGYGVLRDGRRLVRAHRYAWELVNGPIPAGLEIDHVCRVRHCVNPAHLRLATRKQNTENVGVRRDSRTGARGVRMTPRGRFRAEVRHNGRAYSAGVFATLEEADAAVRAKRAELYTHSEEADGRYVLAGAAS